MWINARFVALAVPYQAPDSTSIVVLTELTPDEKKGLRISAQPLVR